MKEGMPEIQGRREGGQRWTSYGLHPLDGGQSCGPLGCIITGQMGHLAPAHPAPPRWTVYYYLSKGPNWDSCGACLREHLLLPPGRQTGPQMGSNLRPVTNERIHKT